MGINDNNAASRDYRSYSTRSRLYFYSGYGVGDLRCVSLTIYDDTRVENDEYFYFTLSSGLRASVIQSQRRMRINILENDGSYLRAILIILYTNITFFFYFTVAMIGMVGSSITRTESSTSISLCIELINNVRLDIRLSASIETQEITASG